MDPEKIREKFGDDYVADERTFVMGIDRRFARHLATRFENLCVLETCTGEGFTTVALAEKARHVFTVEIDRNIQIQAKSNIDKAGLSGRVTFILGDIMDNLRQVDAAFLDPDWAVAGPSHVCRFIDSNTRPPADKLLEKTLESTKNIAIILPPLIGVDEFSGLPQHERERLYLDGKHELFCLYFGSLMKQTGESEFRVTT